MENTEITYRPPFLQRLEKDKRWGNKTANSRVSEQPLPEGYYENSNITARDILSWSCGIAGALYVATKISPSVGTVFIGIFVASLTAAVIQTGGKRIEVAFKNAEEKTFNNAFAAEDKNTQPPDATQKDNAPVEKTNKAKIVEMPLDGANRDALLNKRWFRKLLNKHRVSPRDPG